MRILKVVGILLGLLIMIILILGLIAPTQIKLERSTTIAASPATVFPYLKYLNKQDMWSPWLEMDPDMKRTFSGTDGTVGALTSWEGNSDVGKGEREITLIEDMKQVDTEVRFKEPFESIAKAEMKMEEVEEGVKVSWGFETNVGFPANALYMLMGVKSYVTEDYDKGLAKLKVMAEKEETLPYRLGEIKETDAGKKLFIGVRKVKKIDEITAFYGQVFGELFTKLTQKGVEMAGMPTGLFYSWNLETGEFDMAATIPVNEPVDLGDDFQMIEIPAGKMFTIDYYGPYEGTNVAYDALEAHIKAKGLTPKRPAADEYITDPSTVSSPKEVLTRIYFWGE